MSTKTKREVIKKVKAWCEKNDHTFVSYDHGSCGHDKITVDVWGVEVSTNVACTPASGPVAAGKNAVKSLAKKKRQLIQRIVDGKQRR